jgi:hypothetical protein
MESPSGTSAVVSVICAGKCIQGINKNSLIRGIHRILHVDPELPLGNGSATREVVTIPMNDKDGTWIERHSYIKLAADVSAIRVAAAKVAQRPIQGLTPDEKLQAAYPPRKGQTVSAPIRIRDFRKAQIRPIVFLDGKDTTKPTAELFGRRYLSKAIASRARELGSKGTCQLRKVLRCFFRYGSIPSALIGDYADCGNPGEERQQTTKLGCKNSLVKAGEIDKAGVLMPDDEKGRVALYWDNAIHKGTSVEEAWLLYCAIFHHESIVIDSTGAKHVVLNAPHLRLTLAQFRRWGPRKNREQEAWRKQISDLEYQNNHRPQRGAETDGICDVGKVASADGTPVDVNLVSIDDPLEGAGVGNRIVCRDLYVGLKLGAHFLYGKATGIDALQTLFVVGNTKDELGEKFGIPDWLNDRNFPPIIPAEFRVDHAEFYTEATRLAAKDCGVDLTYPGPCRGDQKGGIESDHHATHQQLDRRLPGANFGRQKKHGESNPRDGACLNIFQYERLWWKQAYYHNCVELVPHLMSLELRQWVATARTQFVPTRINIWNWARDRGYIGYRQYAPDLAMLIPHLLPPIKARVFKDGIRLLRPDTGDKPVLINALVYRSEYFYSSGMDRLAGTPHKDITVKYNSSKPDTIWICHKRDGLQAFSCASKDLILLTECTLQDALNLADKDRLTRARLQSIEDDGKVELVIDRVAVVKSAKMAKAKAISDQPKKPTKKALREGIRPAQKREKARMASEQQATVMAAQSGAAEQSSNEPEFSNEQSSKEPTVQSEKQPPIASLPNSLQRSRLAMLLNMK